MLFLLYTIRECVCHFLRRVLEGKATNEAQLLLRCTLRTVPVMPVKQITPLKILFTGVNVIVIMIETITIPALHGFIERC